MSQLKRLLRAQGDACFFCEAPLTPASASVARLPGAETARSDAMSVACCLKTAALLQQYECKDRLIAMLNPAENGLCVGMTPPAASTTGSWNGPGLAPGRLPRANADLCAPRPVKPLLSAPAVRSASSFQFGRRPKITRCTECDTPAIPGDSRCLLHIK